MIARAAVVIVLCGCGGRTSGGAGDGAVVAETSRDAGDTGMVPLLDVGWVTPSPEPCPYNANGVYSGMPCIAKGITCKWECGDLGGARWEYRMTATCQENGAWRILDQTRCRDL